MLSGLALFVWSGGFSALIAVLIGSYALWPPLEALPAPGVEQVKALAGVVGQTLEGAIGLASVMLLCLFTADFVLGLMSRSTRQFQVFELSMAFKNLFFAILMPILVVAMLAYISREIARVPALMDVLRLLKG